MFIAYRHLRAEGMEDAPDMLNNRLVSPGPHEASSVIPHHENLVSAEH